MLASVGGPAVVETVVRRMKGRWRPPAGTTYGEGSDLDAYHGALIASYWLAARRGAAAARDFAGLVEQNVLPMAGGYVYECGAGRSNAVRRVDCALSAAIAADNAPVFEMLMSMPAPEVDKSRWRHPLVAAATQDNPVYMRAVLSHDLGAAVVLPEKTPPIESTTPQYALAPDAELPSGLYHAYAKPLLAVTPKRRAQTFAVLSCSLDYSSRGRDRPAMERRAAY